MRTDLVLLLVTTAATVITAGASASGPAPPAKESVQIICDGLGEITVVVQRGANSNGAAQIVDA
jgi:hypothetical protein